MAIDALYVPFLLGRSNPPQQEEPSEEACLGSTLRIRLPEDFTVTEQCSLNTYVEESPTLADLAGSDEQTVGSVDVLYGYLHLRPEWCVELPAAVREVYSRWLEDYYPATDEMIVRYDASSRELAVPHRMGAPEPALIARAEVAFARELAEARRRVREGETDQASLQVSRRTLLEAPAVANNLLTLGQITRQAVELFRNTNAFLQGIEAQWGERGEGRRRFLASEDRAMELLQSWLSGEEWASLKNDGYFEVTGSAGGRYRLYWQNSFGIRELTKRGKLGDAYCVVPEGAPALGDILLAQKISLETDERGTLAIANRHRPAERDCA